ncbi:MAG: PAS domain S-box protein [Phycisphaerales bacterium]
MTRQSSSLTRRLGLMLGMGVGYGALVAASLATRIDFSGPAVFWFASGLSFAAFAMSPIHWWPWIGAGVYLGNLFADLTVGGYSVPMSLALSLPNLVEPILGALIWRRLRNDSGATWPDLRTMGSLMAAAGLACAVGAIFGATLLSILAGDSGRWVSTLMVWWLDDLLGVIVVAPVIMMWWTRWQGARRMRPTLQRRVEAIALCAAVLATGWLVFGRSSAAPVPSHFTIYMAPLLIWPALRFGLFGAAHATLLFTVIAVAFTIADQGPFATESLSPMDRVIGLQSTTIVAALSALLLAAAVEERRRSEASLRREINRREETEARFRQIADNINSVFWLSSPDKRVIYYASPAFEKVWGRPVEDFYRDSAALFESIHPDDRERMRDSMPRQARGEWEETFRILRPDGGVRWIYARAFPVRDERGEVIRIAGISEDVTERSETERQLRVALRFADSIINSLPGVFYLFNAEGRFLRWNLSLEQVTGYSSDEIATMSPVAFFRGDDVDRVTERIREVFERGEASVEASLVAKSGQDAPYFLTGKRIRMNDEWCLIGMGIDIADRKDAEAALRETTARLTSVATHIPGLVYQSAVFPDGRTVVEYISDGVQDLFGLASAEVTRPDFDTARLVLEDDRESLQAAMRDAQTNRQTLDHEFRVRTPDGRVRWLHTLATPRDREDGALVWSGVTLDITERKEWERRQRLMMDELDHRVKNTLASVIALAEQTVAQSNDLPSFGETFFGRIRSLAKTHEALAASKWSGVDLADVLRIVLRAYLDSNPPRLHLQGDSVRLPAAAAAPVTLAIHELTTNASKYGALSRATGEIDIHWSHEADGSVHLQWTERGGPEITEPPRPGFGVSLIEGLIEYELSGTARMRFDRAGLRCELSIPAQPLGGRSRPPLTRADETESTHANGQ